MLAENERLHLQKSIAGVEKLASETLSTHENASQAVAFIHQLHRNIDAVTQHAFTLEPKPNCQSGCSHCCIGRRVEVSLPEAFYIAKHLKQLPQDTVNALLERLRVYVENASSHAINPQQACTFLDEHLCSIYAFRPAVCRKAHSLSVEACAASAPSIPQHLNVILDAEALIIGTTQAYQSIGLSAQCLELNAALLAVFTDDENEVNWLQKNKPMSLYSFD